MNSVFEELVEEVFVDLWQINSPKNSIEIRPAETVKSARDKSTFFRQEGRAVSEIEAAVLNVDIRNSTQLNLSTDLKTLIPIYDSFIYLALKCAGYYNAKIENIAGDRVMMLFDQSNCIENAINASILINSFSPLINILTSGRFQCGIGIDYGKMYVSQIGLRAQGDERNYHQSHVWLGKPANVSSKLADKANKSTSELIVRVSRDGVTYPVSLTPEEFLEKIQPIYLGLNAGVLKDGILRIIKDNRYYHAPPILITKEVYDMFLHKCPEAPSLQNKWWTEDVVEISGSKFEVYQASIEFTMISDVIEYLKKQDSLLAKS